MRTLLSPFGSRSTRRRGLSSATVGAVLLSLFGLGVATAPAAQAADQQLTTLFGANNGGAGNTFDLSVSPARGVDISGFDVNVQGNPGGPIVVYTRPGSSVGYEQNPAGWTLQGTVTPLQVQPTNTPTHIDLPMHLDQGSYGFLIAFQTTNGIGYTNGGATTFSDANLTLTTRNGVTAPAMTGGSGVYNGRLWNGSIYYTVSGPDTTITNGPSGPTSDAWPTFNFTGTPEEDVNHFECELSPVEPGGTEGWETCEFRSYYALPDGSYTFSVRAVDHAGIVDGSPATRSFTVDTVNPDTAILGGPAGPTADSSPTFTYQASPEADVDHFECDLSPVEPGGSDGFENCPAAGQDYAALADGQYTFSVRAVDAAGNADASPATRSFTLDTNGPDTSIVSGPSGTTVNAAPSFTYAGSPEADVDHFECKLSPAEPGGSTDFETCPADGTAYAELPDDDYTFSVRAVDALGNADTTPATRGFTVDTAAPDTTIDSGPNGTFGSETATFTYSGTPAGDIAGFECDLSTAVAPGDDPGFEACPADGKSYSDLGGGTYTFSVRAIDAVGNIDPTPATSTFTVASSQPRITAAVASAKRISRYGWYRAPVVVTFTCTGAELTSACPAPVTVATNGAGQVVQRSVSATDGQSDTVTVVLDVDRTGPRVRAGHIDRNRVYNNVPPVTCRGTDKLSGIASCTVRTRVRGDHISYRVVATDRAGNRTVKKGRLDYRA